MTKFEILNKYLEDKESKSKAVYMFENTNDRAFFDVSDIAILEYNISYFKKNFKKIEENTEKFKFNVGNFITLKKCNKYLEEGETDD